MIDSRNCVFPSLSGSASIELPARIGFSSGFRPFLSCAAVVVLGVLTSSAAMAQKPTPYGQPQPIPPSNPYQSSGSYPQQYGQDSGQGYGVPDPPDEPSYPQQYGQSQYGQDQYGQMPDYNGQYGQPGYGQYSGQAQAMGRPQLEQLLAPIALYPDGLLAQMLAAATYPAQVADAAQWRQAQGNASPDQIAYGADQQNWDPSVKALTAFPQVLSQLAQNMRWTVALGNAYYNQPQDVMDTVQELRQRAQQAGNLQNTPQESMDYDDGSIGLEPTDPNMVYVPSYDPWAVYGAAILPYPGFVYAGGYGGYWGFRGIRFGIGYALGAFARFGWGWHGWGMDWHSRSVLFNHQGYFSRSRSVRDWGLPHGGPRAGFGGSRAYGGGQPGRGFGGQGAGRSGYGSNGYRPYSGYNQRAQNGGGLRYGEGAQTPYRGYGMNGTGPGRLPAQGYNGMPQRVTHPEQGMPGNYGRPGGFGSGGYPQGGYRPQIPGGFGSRPSSPVYGNPGQGYRQPSGFPRAPSGGFSGHFAQPQRSGGFWGGGGHSYSAPHVQSFSGHGGGGGHSGGSGGHGGGGHGGGGHHR